MKMPYRILVLDDDEHALSGIVELLRVAGHHVTGAATYDAAKRLLAVSEFDLLVFFQRHPGVAFTREQLMRQVWGPDYFDTVRTVDNFVARLRAKIEDDPDEPKHIETVRGVGYRFNP